MNCGMAILLTAFVVERLRPTRFFFFFTEMIKTEYFPMMRDINF